MSRKPNLTPIQSSFIQLLYDSKINWNDHKVIKGNIAFKVTCGKCKNSRYVLKLSIQKQVTSRKPFHGLCRKCNGRHVYPPPNAYKGYKKEYKKSVTQRGYYSLVISGLSKEDQILALAMKQQNGVSPRVLEHRLVMARSINRPLLRSEHVHHINGNKLDNRIENLEIWSTKHPAGERMPDLQEEIKRLQFILNSHNIPY